MSRPKWPSFLFELPVLAIEGVLGGPVEVSGRFQRPFGPKVQVGL